jgi:hypothetical protein
MEVALAVTAATWLFVLATIAFEHLRIRPLPARRRLQLYGLLLTTTGPLANIFVEVRGWPQSQQHITHIVVLPLVTAGLVMVVGASVNRDRRNRPQRRSPVPRFT